MPRRRARPRRRRPGPAAGRRAGDPGAGQLGRRPVRHRPAAGSACSSTPWRTGPRTAPSAAPTPRTSRADPRRAGHRSRHLRSGPVGGRPTAPSGVGAALLRLLAAFVVVAVGTAILRKVMAPAAAGGLPADDARRPPRPIRPGAATTPDRVVLATDGLGPGRHVSPCFALLSDLRHPPPECVRSDSRAKRVSDRPSTANPSGRQLTQAVVSREVDPAPRRTGACVLAAFVLRAVHTASAAPVVPLRAPMLTGCWS